MSNALSPESAAASGIDLKRLLWVRCGVQPASQPVSPPQCDFALPEKYLAPPAAKRGLHGGGFGPHPRTETKGLSGGVSDLLRRDAVAPRCAEPQRRIRVERETVEPHISCLPNATVLQPARQSPGRGSNRHCGSPICCCRQVDSVQSCWIWEALRLSTSRAYRWRRGSATALLRRGAERACSC